MRVEALERIEAADRAALLDLWVRAWSQSMPAIDFAARRAWLAARIDDGLRADARLIVARSEADRTPLGFALLDWRARYLDQLAVDPARQGQGIATALLGAAKTLCGDRLELHVNQGNDRAVGFYRRNGFAVTGRGVNPNSELPVFAMAWVRPPP